MVEGTAQESKESFYVSMEEREVLLLGKTLNTQENRQVEKEEKHDFYDGFSLREEKKNTTDANGNPLCEKEPYFKMVYYAFYMGEEAG